jgi:YHS domain-containing protein
VSGAADAATRRQAASYRDAEKDGSRVGALARIFRFLLWVIFVAWIVWLLRWLVRRAAQREGSARPPSMSARPLRRDPVCGTYVSEEVSYTLEHAGEVHHFCSLECRERFRARLTPKRAANG